MVMRRTVLASSYFASRSESPRLIWALAMSTLAHEEALCVFSCARTGANGAAKSTASKPRASTIFLLCCTFILFVECVGIAQGRRIGSDRLFFRIAFLGCGLAGKRFSLG